MSKREGRQRTKVYYALYLQIISSNVKTKKEIRRMLKRWNCKYAKKGIKKALKKSK